MALHLVKVSTVFAKDTRAHKNHMEYHCRVVECKIAPILVIQIFCA